MCPVCYIKKLFSKPRRISELPSLSPYGNGAALTPPMGWSSWNTFKNQIDEDLIYQTAVAMKEKGLQDAGYVYVNIDDCWHSNQRDENDDLQGDLTRFAHGIPALVRKINALGLKVGLYGSNGTLTCEDLPASLYRERRDALTLARFGAEYFKYDFCHNIPLPVYAPLVESLTVSSAGDTKETVYPATDALLYGTAKLRKNKRMPSGCYVSGLDQNGGVMEFKNIYAEEEGDYILTVRIKKFGQYEKFLALTVNGGQLKQIPVPPQKTFNYHARFQTKVHLEKGVNTVRMWNPVANKADSAMLQYLNMGEQLKEGAKVIAKERGTEVKPIMFSICEWGYRQPYRWGKYAGNLWRTTPDIRPIWHWIRIIYERTVRLYKYAGVGGWNDPDMLEVGNGKLTEAENKSHFSLWCMMCAPLILGNDLRNITDEVKNIVCHRGMIAINQDPMGIPAKRIKKGKVDVLVKPLANGDAAVCLFNKGGKRTVKFSIEKVAKDAYANLKNAENYAFEELWSEKKGTGKLLTAPVEKHGVAVFRVKAGE